VLTALHFNVRFAALLAMALVCAPLVAQQPESPKQLAQATSEALTKLKPLEEAKKYAELLAVLDGIPRPAPTSYDWALIQNARANTFLKMEQYSKAIEPMEIARNLGKAHKYFDQNAVLGLTYLLAQLCAQEGINSKVPAVQQKFFDKALENFKDWLASTKKPTPEATISYASILYYKAVADPKNLDKATLKLAKQEVEKGLTAATHPKESLYTLLLSILQQENDFERSTELIELYLKQNPTKKDFWQALMGSYLNLANAAQEAKNDAKAKEYLVRVIVTMERAQALGLMQTSKDYMYLVSFYNQAGQGTRAADFLYASLKNGKIDPDPKLWQSLAQILQQANQELRAIALLQEAAKLFPNNGQLELHIGEIYRGMERTKDAYRHYKVAVAKGGLDKPIFAYQVLAFAAFEAEEFDEALSAIKKAEGLATPGSKDQQLSQLKEAIQGAIEERARTKATPIPTR
jgi:predicted Zn-dependent protease